MKLVQHVIATASIITLVIDIPDFTAPRLGSNSYEKKWHTKKLPDALTLL